MTWSFLIQNLNDNALIVFHSESSWVMLNQRFNRSCRFSICNIFQNEYLMTQLYGHSGKGLEIKKGMIQDATFIVAEPGHANQEKMRGDEAKTRRRSRDGNWSKKGEVVYRDKGYFEVAAKGFAATMQRAARGKPLNIKQIMRNDRSSVQRMPCERVYAVTKGVFKAGKVMVTAFCFNLHQMRTLKRKKVVD